MAVTFNKGAKVERWEKNLDDPRKALKQIGVMMVAESQEAFRNQKFGDTAWVTRAPVNVYGVIADFHAGKSAPPQRRFEEQPVLKDTGRLAASIAFRLTGDMSVEVGTNLDYAAVLHGGGPIESETITANVQERLGAWLKNQGPEREEQLGWLLNKKFTDTELRGEVEARPFVGITKQTEEDIAEIVGVHIMETG